ncbi:unnamed protein product, partial [Staurois parvus]
MTDAGICRITVPGTQQEGHRGSAGQVSDRGILEKPRMVSPSVPRGYLLCYTREYRQGGY